MFYICCYKIVKIMWEYKTEIVRLNKKDSIDNKLNEFGKDGWEVFSIESKIVKTIPIRMSIVKIYFEVDYTIKLKKCVE